MYSPSITCAGCWAPLPFGKHILDDYLIRTSGSNRLVCALGKISARDHE